jgi:multiple antibiotic resistance protein
MFKPYLLSFIPIFVAVNIFGILPVFISLTEGISKAEKSKIIHQSVLTGTVIALVFMFIGKVVFLIMGITVSDFKIAGGILLLILSVNLLLPGEPRKKEINTEIGIFPLGTPLITGPAVLTTTLMMIDIYGFAPTFVAIILNMLIVLFVLNNSEKVIRILGVNGTRAFSKVIDILLTAIAVMMIRKGILEILKGFTKFSP